MSGTLFYNARVFTPQMSLRPAAGAEQAKIARYDEGALYAEDGLIRSVGCEADVRAFLAAHSAEDTEEYNCGGACMIPDMTPAIPINAKFFSGR